MAFIAGGLGQDGRIGVQSRGSRWNPICLRWQRRRRHQLANRIADDFQLNIVLPLKFVEPACERPIRESMPRSFTNVRMIAMFT